MTNVRSGSFIKPIISRDKGIIQRQKTHVDSNIGIYVIEVPDLKRAYVGQSKNVSSRIRQHKYALNGGQYHKQTSGLQRMQDDFNSLGSSSFKFFQICECDPSDLFEQETYYCKQYSKDGYEMYNTYINTEMYGVNCPKEFVDVI